MSWLARLKKQKGPDTHPTEPTKPGFVGSVGTPDGHIHKISGSVEPANDAPDTWNVYIPPGTSAATIAKFRAASSALDAAQRAAGIPPLRDPDANCWPHSAAMTGAEIDTFTARLVRFTDKGLDLDTSERLADKLVIRDRERDDKRLCLECGHPCGPRAGIVGLWGLETGRDRHSCKGCAATQRPCEPVAAVRWVYRCSSTSTPRGQLWAGVNRFN